MANDVIWHILLFLHFFFLKRENEMGEGERIGEKMGTLKKYNAIEKIFFPAIFFCWKN